MFFLGAGPCLSLTGGISLAHTVPRAGQVPAQSCEFKSTWEQKLEPWDLAGLPGGLEERVGAFCRSGPDSELAAWLS